MKFSMLGRTRLALMGAVALMLVALGVTASTVAAQASTKQPFSAIAILGAIDEGDVAPAGNSGRFVVQNRTVVGEIVAGNISGLLTFEYGSNVPITTQSGQIHGRLTIEGASGALTANARGSSRLDLCPLPTPPIPPVLSGVPGLVVEGKLTFIEGQPGNGQFTACVWPQLDAEGHITGLIFGAAQLSGHLGQ